MIGRAAQVSPAMNGTFKGHSTCWLLGRFLPLSASVSLDEKENVILWRFIFLLAQMFHNS